MPILLNHDAIFVRLVVSGIEPGANYSILKIEFEAIEVAPLKNPKSAHEKTARQQVAMRQKAFRKYGSDGSRWEKVVGRACCALAL